MKLILFALFALVVGMVIACAGTSKEEAYPTQEVISPTASKIIPTQDVITLPLIPSPNADEIKAIDRRLSALETKIVAIADLEDRLDTIQKEIYGGAFFVRRINSFSDSRIDDLEDDVRSLENDVRRLR